MMFKTIMEISSASIKIQRSEFITVLYPLEDVNSIKSLLAAHNEKYKDATHNCYGYVIGKKQENQYYSDQGEPSGTAGKPILNTLLKYNLTNVLAVVTRYYGGINLGVRGLIDAYTESVDTAISKSTLTEYISTNTLHITCNYNILETLKHLLKQFKANVLPIEFTESVQAEVIIPDEVQDEVHKILDDFIQKGQLSIIA